VLRLTATIERGFTLIEMVIVLAIATAVFGVTGGVVMSMVGGSSQSATTSQSARKASAVLARFEQDVRFAQSPDVVEHPRAGDDLRNMLLWGVSRTPAGDIVHTTPDQCNQSVDVALRDYCQYEDFTYATSTQLWMRSDVRSATAADDGTECVRWEIRSGALWRTVHKPGPAPDCRLIGGTMHVGPVVEDTRMLDAPPANSGLGRLDGSAAGFGYMVIYNPTAASHPTGTIVEPSGCVTQQPTIGTPLVGPQRTFVSTVTLDLSAVVAGSQSTAARNRYAVSASVLGRATDDYARAAGCAY
jgi:prepilin-type N-terminal cleavage/methylation domain-containing protein